MVGPAGFGKPRPKNSPLDCFYPAGRGTPGTGCSNSAYVLPPPFITNKKMQPLRGCILVGPAGFEPTQWRSQSPLPYRLATAQQKKRPRSIITVRSLVGCLERFELSASRATIWRANQLRHRHHRMRPKGLEPLAHCLEGSCSIHLSYGRARVSSCCLGTCCENYNITWGALCQ